jgi:hypothetical protein
LFTNIQGSVVLLNTSTATIGQGLTTVQFLCNQVNPGNYFVSWIAYKQSDTTLSNPMKWSKSSERRQVVC